jgi:hypothetical protein
MFVNGIESRNEIVNFIRENKGKRFNVTYSNGTYLEKVRLFVSSDGTPAYYKKGSRKYGYELAVNGMTAIGIVKSRNSNLTNNEKFAKNARKLVSILKQSGLWQNIVDRMENEYNYEFSKMVECEADFAYSILNWKVKRMNFRPKAKWWISKESANEENEQKLNYIKECVANKRDCTVTTRNSYDIRFDYVAEKQKAWYSEEYKGCANGHYYLAIDSEHAIYYEKD